MYVCRLCSNNSLSYQDNMQDCCYDDFNILTFGIGYYFKIIKIQRWFRKLKQKITTIVIVSGFFDPIGPNHILLFNEAKKLGDYLIVGINSDECAIQKKGQKCFMPYNDRANICENLKMVDKVVSFNDKDGTACLLLQDIYDKYKSKVDKKIYKLIFANGGDRHIGDTPEQNYVDKFLPNKVKMEYGVGGTYKRASSSEYLRDWVNNTMKRYNINFELKNKY